jgi:hypothetical protein
VALALARVQEERFVRLGDTPQRGRLNSLGQCQKAVAPTECCAVRHLHSLGGLPDGRAIAQRFRLREPLLLLA